MTYVGDFLPGATIHLAWGSYDASGASVTRATNGTISVYQDASTTQSTDGVTDTEDFDSLTGVHWVAIDTSADGTFYAAGHDYTVVLSAATIDGETVNAVIGSFSILNRIAPANFNALAITAGGAVTAGTVSDKTGYSIAGAVPTLEAAQANLEEYIDQNAASLPVESGQAQAGTATTLTLADGAPSDTAARYVGNLVYITGGKGARQASRRIVSANISDPTAVVVTVNTAFAVTPDATSQYKLLPSDTAAASGSAFDPATDAVIVGSMQANVLTASALAADAVTEIQSGLATDAVVAALQGNVDAITNMATRLLQWAENRKTQDAAELTLYDDDGTTPLVTKAVTDDGTTVDLGAAEDAA